MKFSETERFCFSVFKTLTQNQKNYQHMWFSWKVIRLSSQQTKEQTKQEIYTKIDRFHLCSFLSVYPADSCDVENSRCVRRTIGVGRIFSRGAHLRFFTEVVKKTFPGVDKSGEISIYPIESTKTTFFAKNLIGKFQISKFRRAKASCPFLPTTTHGTCFYVHMTKTSDIHKCDL